MRGQFESAKFHLSVLLFLLINGENLSENVISKALGYVREWDKYRFNSIPIISYTTNFDDL